MTSHRELIDELLDFLFQHMIRYFSLLGSGYHVLGSRNDMPVTVIPFPSLGERKIILGNGILVTVNSPSHGIFSSFVSNGIPWEEIYVITRR